MNRLKIVEVYNDHPAEDDRRRHEEGLRILARMIARAIQGDRSSREMKTALPRAPVKASADRSAKAPEGRARGRHIEPPHFFGRQAATRESGGEKVSGV